MWVILMSEYKKVEKWTHLGPSLFSFVKCWFGAHDWRILGTRLQCKNCFRLREVDVCLYPKRVQAHEPSCDLHNWEVTMESSLGKDVLCKECGEARRDLTEDELANLNLKGN